MASAAVGVLLPIAPDAPWLTDAIESLKRQTFPDWELVAILDGPSEANRCALSQANLGPRLKVIELQARSGIATALNTGLAATGSRYVARLDADDECEPNRFAVQVQELERRPNVWVLGSSATVIDGSGQVVSSREVPSGPTRVRRHLAWRNSLIHPSVLMRRAEIEELGGYNPGVQMFEDYELWLRVAARADIDNLTARLLRLRVHPHQYTRTERSADTPPIRDARRTLAGSRMGRAGADVRHGIWLAYQCLHNRIST